MTAEELNKIATNHSKKGDYIKADSIAKEAVMLAQISGDKGEEAVAFHILGIVANETGNYQNAEEYHQHSLMLYEKIGNKIGLAKVISNMGFMYLRLSDYSRALDYLGKSLLIYEEFGDKSGIASVMTSMGLVYSNLSDYPRALEYYGKALTINEELGDKRGQACVTGNIGLVYTDLSDYPRALEYLGKALLAYEELQDKAHEATSMGNIGNIYMYISNHSYALEYLTKALSANEKLGNKAGLATNTANIGLVYASLGNYDQALEYYMRALNVLEEIGENSDVANIVGNIGLVYMEQGNYYQALEYYRRSLAMYEESGVNSGIAYITGNIGFIYSHQDFESYNAAKAEKYLLKSLAISEEISAKKQQYELHKFLSDLYKQEREWEKYSYHIELYHSLEKEVISEETQKQAQKFAYERKIAEQEKQTAIERAETQARLDEQQKLLHNVLPPIIADRLLRNETFIADSYPSVSVLFMDLVGFTRIAAIIPPRHLIYLLNTIFSNADAVMEKHGLEKIKTIGDAYMAVAGAPVHQEDHAQRAALAAIDVMEAMNNLSVIIPEELGETNWTQHVGEIQVRIGLHCGEAIGGVIGDKKFTFDLWGDAVNTASRMESHGEAGKIHVSEEFKNAVVQTQHAVSLQFIPRGEMEIKGKGIMRTYFLEKNV